MPTDIVGTAPYDKGDSLTRITRYCQYWVFGEEFGEPTEEKPEGYHHWQFFIQFTKDRNWKWIHEQLPGIHVEARKGTCEEAMMYQMKDGNFVQGGQVIDRPGQGARSDLEVYVEDCKTLTDRELWVKHPSNMARYHRVPDRVRTAFAEPRTQVTQLRWLYGEPGCGKTLFVQQTYPDHYSQDKSQWWDGYCGHKVVLVDELNHPDLRYDTLLKIGNKGAYKVPVKGGYVDFSAERLYIVSNTLPEQVYKQEFNLDGAAALCRRCKFFRCSRAGPHQLQLQLVEYHQGNWVDRGEPVVKEIQYPDEDDDIDP